MLQSGHREKLHHVLMTNDEALMVDINPYINILHIYLAGAHIPRFLRLCGLCPCALMLQPGYALESGGVGVK
jgi:hypothetical protein